MKNYIKEAIIIGLCIIVGFAFFGGKTTIEYGAAPGPEHYEYNVFYDGLRAVRFVQSGATTTLTGGTATTTTITGAQVRDSALIQWLGDNSDGAATATLPSATNLTDAGVLLEPGDSKTLIYRNTAATGSTTDFVAGTDVTMRFTDGGNTLIDGGNDARITFMYIAPSTTLVIVEELD